MNGSADSTSSTTPRTLASLLDEIERTPRGQIDAGRLDRWAEEMRERLAGGETLPPPAGSGPSQSLPAHLIWEEDAAFRQVFLCHFEDDDRAALRQVGSMLYRYVLERSADYGPAASGEAPIVAELRAAVADLRVMWGFFRMLEVEGEDSHRGRSGIRLTDLAGRSAVEMSRLAERIEDEIAR